MKGYGRGPYWGEKRWKARFERAQYRVRKLMLSKRKRR